MPIINSGVSNDCLAYARHNVLIAKLGGNGQNHLLGNDEAAMDLILEWDKRLLLWLNSYHAPWLDPVMLLLTKTLVWLPLYILLAFLIFKTYKREGFFILIAVALAIFLAGQITDFMKVYFARLRPSNEMSLRELIHVVANYRGGMYGFASGHAANTFAVAFLLWLVLRKHYRWAGLIFLWALFMCYTRIYLGVHYPGDIIVGTLVGICCGATGFLAYRLLHRQWMLRNRSKTTE